MAFGISGAWLNQFFAQLHATPGKPLRYKRGAGAVHAGYNKRSFLHN